MVELVILTNSTLSLNAASGSSYSSGGGIENVSGMVNLTNSTISNNQANANGGGIYNYFGTVNSKNSIIAGNTASEGPDFSGSLTSQGYNLIGSISGISGNISSDIINPNPLLGPLANNGGPTQTLALLAGSPAIDKGSAVDGVSTDQRGATRSI